MHLLEHDRFRLGAMLEPIVCPKCKISMESGSFTQEGFEPIRAHRCPSCRFVAIFPLGLRGFSNDFLEAVIGSIHYEVKTSKNWMGSIELLMGIIPHLPISRVNEIQNTFLRQFDLQDLADRNVNVIGILFNADRSLPPEALGAYIRTQIS